MTEEAKIAGTCLCGAVRVTAKVAPTFAACHCGMCRRWGGGPLLAVPCGSVEIEGEESVKVFDSSQWAERGFCATCGSHLFYRLKQSQHTSVAVGLFGDAISAELDVQYFIDKKPANYAFANETKCLTEAEVYELFAPKD